MTLGQKIRQARIERGLTQKELVGDHITRNMLSKIENDSAAPSVRTLEFLAGRLGLSAAFFMSDLTLSDGTSPDGLDDMRSSYREGRYDECIDQLQNTQTAGTTDEGYLLRALADLAAARAALALGDYVNAKEYADSSDYYNKQGLYYSAEIDAEMSLILAECAIELDITEFDENAREFNRAVNAISFTNRFELAQAEYLIKTGSLKQAQKALDSLSDNMTPILIAKKHYLAGLLLIKRHEWQRAKDSLLKAEELGFSTPALFASLENCFRELEDFKMAYKYAVIQKK